MKEINKIICIGANMLGLSFQGLHPAGMEWSKRESFLAAGRVI